MTLADPLGVKSPDRPPGRVGWALRLVASRRFQSFCASVPGLRSLARRDGEQLFDLVSGFVQSQILWAVVELRLLHRLFEGAATAEILADGAGLSVERMAALCDGAVALGLMKKGSNGDYALARKGAAILGVPGLEAMISHHSVFYRDMADPLAVLRGAPTELADFWPYVFGAAEAQDPEVARRYSALMSDSQALIAEETLQRANLSGAGEVLDLGGGTGAFLMAVGRRHRRPKLHLFDLPAVVPEARQRFAAAGLSERLRITPGSFRDDPLPRGADVISLVRVLYDHADDTVMDLLRAAHRALPEGGRLLVSEPMTGGRRPHRAGDAYFAFYCMAMGTGRARSPSVLSEMIAAAGFRGVSDLGTHRPFVTHVLDAQK